MQLYHLQSMLQTVQHAPVMLLTAPCCFFKFASRALSLWFPLAILSISECVWLSIRGTGEDLIDGEPCGWGFEAENLDFFRAKENPQTRDNNHVKVPDLRCSDWFRIASSIALNEMTLPPFVPILGVNRACNKEMHTRSWWARLREKLKFSRTNPGHYGLETALQPPSSNRSLLQQFHETASSSGQNISPRCRRLLQLLLGSIWGSGSRCSLFSPRLEQARFVAFVYHSVATRDTVHEKASGRRVKPIGMGFHCFCHWRRSLCKVWHYWASMNDDSMWSRKWLTISTPLDSIHVWALGIKKNLLSSGTARLLPRQPCGWDFFFWLSRLLLCLVLHISFLLSSLFFNTLLVYNQIFPSTLLCLHKQRAVALIPNLLLFKSSISKFDFFLSLSNTLSIQNSFQTQTASKKPYLTAGSHV